MRLIKLQECFVHSRTSGVPMKDRKESSQREAETQRAHCQVDLGWDEPDGAAGGRV